MSRKKVMIVGVGIDPRGRQVTLEALDHIKSADVVFATRTVSKVIENVAPDVHIEEISTREATVDFNLLADRICSSASQRIVVAVRGDSTFASLGTRLYRELTRRGVECRILPGISSLQVAAAKLGLDWSNSVILDVHARPSEEILRTIASLIGLGFKVITTLHPRVRGNDVAKFLVESGLQQVRVSVCENLGRESERVLVGLAEDLARTQTDYNAILIAEPLADMRWTTGTSDCEIITNEKVPGPTKEEIRAITAAKARLKPGYRVLEIGCGTGALTVELALRVAPDGVVYAVDYRDEAIKTTMLNLRRFRVAHLVKLVHGRAPEVLESLDCKFNVAVIEGTENLERMLEVVSKMLEDPARIIINAVTMDTVNTACSVLRRLGFNVEITLCYIAKTREVKGKLMFTAHNPVFIITGEQRREM